MIPETLTALDLAVYIFAAIGFTVSLITLAVFAVLVVILIGGRGRTPARPSPTAPPVDSHTAT